MSEKSEISEETQSPVPGHRFFVTAPTGMVDLVADEVTAFGGHNVRASEAGVTVHGDMELAYRICLWSRLANRVLFHLGDFEIENVSGLYGAAMSIDWRQHFGEAATLAIDFSGKLEGVRNSQFASQRIKDAIIDQLREETGERPSVDTWRPSLRINAHARHGTLSLAIDFSGGSLHRRGYREKGHEAPLKENLAAAILTRADWPALAQSGATLVDPMCGTGTLLIEGAWMATDSAPGLLRDYYGFTGWRQHHRPMWDALVDEARERQKKGLERVPAIRGYDHDPRSLELATMHVKAAGMEGIIHIEGGDARSVMPHDEDVAGLLVCNPPYGERMGRAGAVEKLYQEFGTHIATAFAGWQASIITQKPEEGEADLGRSLGLRAHRRNNLFNGTIPCSLLHFRLNGARQVPAWRPTDAAAGFVNRLHKNRKRLKRWAKKVPTDCYRLYDADLPEYAVAVDVYGEHLHVQEYAPPATIDPRKAQDRMRDVIAVLPEALDVDPDKIHLKVRKRQRGGSQYEKQGTQGAFFQVHERDKKFWVNLDDYLDSGIFLDHRPTRAMVSELAEGGDFLNLFAYTGTVTVYAAMGGARTTTTVDMSHTYLDWAARNFALNDLDRETNYVIRADCMPWIEKCDDVFDLIFLDPPTFSRSKSMQTDFDIQRDHVDLLHAVSRLLAPKGVLLFSNNSRRFKLDAEAMPSLKCEEISAMTLPQDFERSPKIHRCWSITRKA